MNTERLNEIYNKFPKVELEKVELSKISDLKTAYNALVKVKDIMDGNLNKAKKSAGS